jgi:hypothetical protein
MRSASLLSTLNSTKNQFCQFKIVETITVNGMRLRMAKVAGSCVDNCKFNFYQPKINNPRTEQEIV